ncbi:hypothetical protein KUG85_10210 [Nitratireductor sp. L1-7-SE]|uniref:DUF2188 domain-containing protein n=1 Tax=Nitratireductor rhodophyticola TaxID=2854036 RepID=A0ABS7RB21_9HYPH|nr:hypothetical protein [Nitratireductor rhodophyticola]MBY8918118.1 hypothetical protein [Nitratireductor rhodophyticola]MBY8921073.1 hypothetical protein [Nitratireductor rhodophyticola]
MKEPRISARLRYEPIGNRYQVVRDGEMIGTHSSKETAAIAIRDRGAGGRQVGRADFGSGPNMPSSRQMCSASVAHHENVTAI